MKLTPPNKDDIINVDDFKIEDKLKTKWHRKKKDDPKMKIS